MCLKSEAVYFMDGRFVVIFDTCKQCHSSLNLIKGLYELCHPFSPCRPLPPVVVGHILVPVFRVRK